MNTHDIDIHTAIMDVITDVWDRAKQINEATYEVLDLIEADSKRRGEQRVIGRIKLDGNRHPRAELSTGYDENGDQWKEGTPIYSAPQPQQQAILHTDLDLAAEIWAAAQLVPGEGIEHGENRIAAILSESRQTRGESVAWLVTGPYEKVAFADKSTAESYCKGLNSGFGSSAYSTSPLYLAPQPAEPVKLPSDDDLEELMGRFVGYSGCIHDDAFVHCARALLSRYGQPAASAEP